MSRSARSLWVMGSFLWCLSGISLYLALVLADLLPSFEVLALLVVLVVSWGSFLAGGRFIGRAMLATLNDQGPGKVQ